MQKKVQEIARKLKPPRCPKCGSILYSFNYVSKEIVRATYYGNREYVSWETIDVLDTEYRCPECDETLFYDEGEAEKFLRGES